MQGEKTVREEQYKEHLSTEDRRSEHQPVTGDNHYLMLIKQFLYSV